MELLILWCGRNRHTAFWKAPCKKAGRRKSGMLTDLLARIFVLCFLLAYGLFVVAFLEWILSTWLESRRKPQHRKRELFAKTGTAARLRDERTPDTQNGSSLLNERMPMPPRAAT